MRAITAIRRPAGGQVSHQVFCSELDIPNTRIDIAEIAVN
jgi:hypothetical protein